MNDVHSKNGFNPSISRRKFVKGIAAGGVVASIPMSINAKEELPQKVYSSVLSGTVIDLVVEVQELPRLSIAPSPHRHYA